MDPYDGQGTRASGTSVYHDCRDTPFTERPDNDGEYEVEVSPTGDVDDDLLDFLEELDHLDEMAEESEPTGAASGTVIQDSTPTPPTRYSSPTPPPPHRPGEVSLLARTPPRRSSPIAYQKMGLAVQHRPGEEDNPHALPKPHGSYGHSGSPLWPGQHVNAQPFSDPLESSLITPFIPNVRNEIRDAECLVGYRTPSPGDPTIERESIATMVAVTMDLDSRLRRIMNYPKSDNPSRQPEALHSMRVCIGHFKKICEMYRNCLDLPIDALVYTCAQVGVNSLTVATSRDDRSVESLVTLANHLLRAVRRIGHQVDRIQLLMQVTPLPPERTLFQRRLLEVEQAAPTPYPPGYKLRMQMAPQNLSSESISLQRQGSQQQMSLHGQDSGGQMSQQRQGSQQQMSQQRQGSQQQMSLQSQVPQNQMSQNRQSFKQQKSLQRQTPKQETSPQREDS